MLSKCANPTCSAGFRYLRQGRIFNLEVRPPSCGGDGEARHKVEHFWLCEHCATMMEVVWENGMVSTRPQHSPARGKLRAQGVRAGRWFVS